MIRGSSALSNAVLIDSDGDSKSDNYPARTWTVSKRLILAPGAQCLAAFIGNHLPVLIHHCCCFWPCLVDEVVKVAPHIYVDLRKVCLMNHSCYGHAHPGSDRQHTQPTMGET